MTFCHSLSASGCDGAGGGGRGHNVFVGRAVLVGGVERVGGCGGTDRCGRGSALHRDGKPRRFSSRVLVSTNKFLFIVVLQNMFVIVTIMNLLSKADRGSIFESRRGSGRGGQ